MEVAADDEDRQIRAHQQVDHVIVEVVQFLVAVLQLLVDGRQFLVHRLKLFLGGFQFFVRALQFFVAGKDFFVGGAQLLARRILLFDHRLQVFMRRDKLLLQARQLVDIRLAFRRRGKSVLLLEKNKEAPARHARFAGWAAPAP